jgi:segregation and condensation protein B
MESRGLTTTERPMPKPHKAKPEPTEQPASESAGESSAAVAINEPEPTPAPEVISTEAPAPAIDDAIIAELALKVEALLITSGKAIPALRLAQATGLVAMPELGSEDPQAAGGERAAAQIVVKKRKKKASAGPDPMDLIKLACAKLNETYEQTGRTFRVEPVAGGLRLMTLPSWASLIAAYHGQSASTRLSKAAIETLAIIAYKQPCTRAQLEAVRGVACGEVLRSLMERRLVTIVGRAEELGRPILYGTSKAFLEAFGLSSLKDLPAPSELGMGKS